MTKQKLKNNQDKWINITFYISIFFLSIYCLLNISTIILTHSVPTQEIKTISNIQIALSILPHHITFFIAIMTSALFFYKKNSIKNKLNLKNWHYWYIFEAIGIEIAIFIPLALIILAFQYILKTLNIDCEPPPIQEIIEKCSWIGFAIFAFGAMIIAPITEELLFRRIIYSFINQKSSQITAVILTSALFASIHFTLVQIPALFVLGCILQYMYIVHKSIYIPMILHCVHNTVAMFFLMIMKIMLSNPEYKELMQKALENNL